MRTSVKCAGQWLHLGLTVDSVSGLALTIDEVSAEDATTLKAWIEPIAASVGAQVLVTDDADGFKTVADELGRLASSVQKSRQSLFLLFPFCTILRTITPPANRRMALHPCGGNRGKTGGGKRTKGLSFVKLDKKNNPVTEDTPCQASISQNMVPSRKPFWCH